MTKPPPFRRSLGSTPVSEEYADSEAARTEVTQEGPSSGFDAEREGRIPSRRPRLRLPLPQGGTTSTTSSETEDAVEHRVSPYSPPPARGSWSAGKPPRGQPQSLPVVVRKSPEPSPSPFPTAGPLTVLALGLVAVVGAVFVRGTHYDRPPKQLILDRPRQTKGAVQRGVPSRTWQDRYRSQHPGTRRRASDLPTLPPVQPPHLYRVPKARVLPLGDGNQWTLDQVSKAQFSPLEAEVATPHYRFSEGEDDVPEVAMVKISSIPPGARVELAGKLLGKTPFLRARPKGYVGDRVSLSLPGYLPFEGFLTESSSGHLVLEIRLSPDPTADPRLRGEKSP